MNPDQKLQHVLRSKGYEGTFEQMVTSFIKDRTSEGKYTEVFSSYVHTPEQQEETEKNIPPSEQPEQHKPWYKKLFS